MAFDKHTSQLLRYLLLPPRLCPAGPTPPSKILSFVALPWQEADATNGLSLLQTCEDAEMSHAMDLCSKHLGADMQRVALARFGADVIPAVSISGFFLPGGFAL